MTTKESGLFLNINPSGTKNLHNENSNQFSNFNLNQGHKYSDIALDVQSFNKSNNNKNNGYTVANRNQEKEEPWHKTSAKNSNFNPFKNSNVEVGKDVQKRWTNDKHDSTKINHSSTLSLHIAAYENFIEADSNEFKEEYMPKKFKAFKSVVSGAKFQQDTFEFPRQMEDGNKAAPEVQQFKASQKLQKPMAENYEPLAPAAPPPAPCENQYEVPVFAGNKPLPPPPESGQPRPGGAGAGGKHPPLLPPTKKPPPKQLPLDRKKNVKKNVGAVVKPAQPKPKIRQEKNKSEVASFGPVIGEDKISQNARNNNNNNYGNEEGGAGGAGDERNSGLDDQRSVGVGNFEETISTVTTAKNNVRFFCLITSGIMAAFFALAAIGTGIFAFVRL